MPQNFSPGRDHDYPWLINLLYCLFLGWWYLPYLTLASLPSVDLPGHVAIVESYEALLWHGVVSFYDPRWFSGWPAFEFYGFLGHWATALLSSIFGFLVKDSAQLAVNFLCWLGVALLPLSFYLAFVPIFDDLTGGNGGRARFALLAGALTVWFLNLDLQQFGLGAGAIVHAGLYSQLFAWHLFLFHLGSLLRARSEHSIFTPALTFALILLAHPLTAIFSGAIACFFVIYYRETRTQLLLAHALSLLLTSFWFVPMLYDSARLLIPHPAAPNGDILAMLLRYRVSEAARAVLATWSGVVSPIEVGYLAALGLVIFSLVSRELHRSSRWAPIAILMLLSILVLSSESLTSLIPLSIHYYRYFGLILLVVLGLLCSAPGVLYRNSGSSNLRTLCDSSLILAAVFTVATSALLPEPVTGNLRGGAYKGLYAELDQTSEEIENIAPESRVLFESPEPGSEFAERAPHYLPSKLYRTQIFEVMNGLFVQSSLTNHFAAMSAEALGIRTYSSPFVTNPSIPAEIAVLQLQALGITHLILSPPTAEKLATYFPSPPQSAGRYRVLQVQGAGKTSYVTKRILGYFDSSGSLPFTYLSIYFYLNPELWREFELVEITDPKAVPPGLSGLIVNGTETRSLHLGSLSVIFLPEIAPRFLPQAESVDKFNPGMSRYQRITSRLDLINLKSELGKLNLMNIQPDHGPPPVLTWNSSMQTFVLDRVIPGDPILLNYSYSPNFKAVGATLYRGLAERMILFPEADQVILSYQPRSRIIVQIAIGISLFAFVVLAFIGIRALFAERSAA